MEYGNKLNPERSLRTAKGIKGTRQKVIVTHNPSEIGQNQLLMVKFPNLASDDVIIPGTANPSFNIELTSTADPNKRNILLKGCIQTAMQMRFRSSYNFTI